MILQADAFLSYARTVLKDPDNAHLLEDYGHGDLYVVSWLAALTREALVHDKICVVDDFSDVDPLLDAARQALEEAAQQN